MSYFFAEGNDWTLIINHGFNDLNASEEQECQKKKKVLFRSETNLFFSFFAHFFLTRVLKAARLKHATETKVLFTF